MKNKYKEEIPAIRAPAFRALSSVGIVKLTDLCKYSEKELLALHGFSPKALKILQLALKEKGLSFKNDKIKNSR